MKRQNFKFAKLKSPLLIPFFISLALFFLVQGFGILYTSENFDWGKYMPYIVAIVGFIFSFLISGIIQIQSKVNPLRGDIKDLIDDFEKKLASFKVQTHVNNIGNFITYRRDNIIMYETLNETVRDYLNDLKIVDEREFSVRGEENALIVYSTFWRKLVKKQREIKNYNESQTEDKKVLRPIIARITHSNNIAIWDENNPHVKELLKLQRDFTVEGGKLIRFFTILKDNIDSVKQAKIDDVIKIQRNKYNLNVWSVPTEHEELDYDYLYLHDEGIVLRWLTTTSGQKLASIQITDQIMDDDRTAKNWEKVWYRCIDLHKDEKSLKLSEDTVVVNKNKIDSDDISEIEKALNLIIPKDWQFGEDLL